MSTPLYRRVIDAVEQRPDDDTLAVLEDDLRRQVASLDGLRHAARVTEPRRVAGALLLADLQLDAVRALRADDQGRAVSLCRRMLVIVQGLRDAE